MENSEVEEEKRLHEHVDWFAQQMKEKISKSLARGKGGWDTESNTAAWHWVADECEELHGAIFDGGSEGIIEEAVDLANCAMFFAAREREKEWPSNHPEAVE